MEAIKPSIKKVPTTVVTIIIVRKALVEIAGVIGDPVGVYEGVCVLGRDDGVDVG